MLWNKDASLMRSGLFGPKTAAVADAKMVLNLLTGKAKYDENVVGPLSMTWLTPDPGEHPAKRFREMLDSGETIVAPGVFNGLTALQTALGPISPK